MKTNGSRELKVRLQQRDPFSMRCKNSMQFQSWIDMLNSYACFRQKLTPRVVGENPNWEGKGINCSSCKCIFPRQWCCRLVCVCVFFFMSNRWSTFNKTGLFVICMWSIIADVSTCMQKLYLNQLFTSFQFHWIALSYFKYRKNAFTNLILNTLFGLRGSPASLKSSPFIYFFLQFFMVFFYPFA